MPTELPTNPDLSSEVDDLRRQVARLLRLLGQIDAGGQALSISQFCARNDISRSFFYKLKKGRKAPRTMQVGGRQIISPEAERDWRLEREREAAEAANQLSPHAGNPAQCSGKAGGGGNINGDVERSQATRISGRPAPPDAET
jgi:predicted DNA-binding transcriptional regulator AlpA